MNALKAFTVAIAMLLARIQKAPTIVHVNQDSLGTERTASLKVSGYYSYDLFNKILQETDMPVNIACDKS